MVFGNNHGYQDAQIMARSFTCISFQYVGRVEDNVAHNLGRYACHVTDFSV